MGDPARHLRGLGTSTSRFSRRKRVPDRRIRHGEPAPHRQTLRLQLWASLAALEGRLLGDQGQAAEYCENLTQLEILPNYKQIFFSTASTTRRRRNHGTLSVDDKQQRHCVWGGVSLPQLI